MKNPKRMINIVVAAALTFGVGGYTLFSYMPPVQAQGAMENVGKGTIDWAKGSVKVTGSGAPPERGTMSQKRLMARRAAIADGYRQLAEMINGVRVDSETVVKDFVTESDSVRTQISALIKGATVGDTRYLSDGSVEVDMIANLYGPNSLGSVMQPAIFEKKDIPTQPASMNNNNTNTTNTTTTTTTTNNTHNTANTNTTTTNTNNNNNSSNTTTVSSKPDASGKYSGLIVDCRGLGIKPAMSPAIYDANGREIYIGKRPIDPDVVVNMGIVSYSTSPDAAKSNKRIGSSPMVIKAAKAGGKMKADAVIGTGDADQLLSADNASKFLDGSKVVFIID